MRPSSTPQVDQAQATVIHEVAMAAELSYLWATQLAEAIDGFSHAARTFFQDYVAGRSPDPMPLLVRYGAANELLEQLNRRFEVGAEALGELRFSLSAPPAEPAVGQEDLGSVLFFRPGRDRDTDSSP